MAWTADAIHRSSEQVSDLLAATEDIRRRWGEQLADVRSDAAACRLAELIPHHLVVTAPIVAELLDVSGPTARAAIEALAARGILEPLPLHPSRPGRPAQWWMAGELIAVVGRWSR